MGGHQRVIADWNVGCPVVVLWWIRGLCALKIALEAPDYNMKLEDGDNGVPHQTPPPKSTTPEGSRNPSLSDMAVKQELSAETATQRQADAPRSQAGNGQKKNVSNSKDPLRPRRKKARRACFACQRAHLTCGQYLFTVSECVSPFSWMHESAHKKKSS